MILMISGPRSGRLLGRRYRLFRCRRLRHDVIGVLRHRRGGQTEGERSNESNAAHAMSPATGRTLKT
jgi:hypothetical protein